jgi:hypothetical protein
MRVSNKRRRETCVIMACLTLGPSPKISGPGLSLSTLSNFLIPHSLSLIGRPRNYRATAACCRCCHRLPSSVPALEHATASSPVLEHAATSTSASERSVTVLFLKPSVRRSWLLSCRHCRPRPCLPQSAPPPSTSTPPPSECATDVLFLKP